MKKNTIDKMPIWLTESGERVSCVEKIKIMEENIVELSQMAQDMYEDGILMNIDPNQIKQFLVYMMHGLRNPYKIY